MLARNPVGGWAGPLARSAPSVISRPLACVKSRQHRRPSTATGPRYGSSRTTPTRTTTSETRWRTRCARLRGKWDETSRRKIGQDEHKKGSTNRSFYSRCFDFVLESGSFSSCFEKKKGFVFPRSPQHLL